MDREQEIRERISGWMQANRVGKTDAPYLWSIYELNSIYSKVNKTTPTNANNFSIVDLEASLEHLMNCMSFSTHVKYFAIRFREEQSKPGIINNFPNPYHQSTSIAKIGNMAQANQGGDMMQIVIGLITTMGENQRADKEENNAIVTKLMLDNQANEYKLKEYKLKQENIRLQQENANIGSNESSFFREVFNDFKPEIKQVISSIASKKTPYKEDDYEEESEPGEQGEQAQDDREQDVLNKSLNLIISSGVENPVMLVYKMSVVLSKATEEERGQLLGAIQAKFNQIKTEQANG